MEKNPIPQGRYLPAKKSNGFIYSAGMTPRLDGKLILEEKVTRDKEISFYQEAVVQATKNALTAIKNTLEEGEVLEEIINMTVYVNSEEGFTAHSKIADLGSNYLFEALGEKGLSPRAALGVKTIPGNAPVEIQLVASYK
ncbi:RidA family protein [Peptoniphilus harei]|uniref:RidA family protein n=1 Tax=Peptoniphilus harei TaxID=54005 RepID=UPI0011DE13E9|nr:RidA family protein [Peptoniphilus harei]